MKMRLDWIDADHPLMYFSFYYAEPRLAACVLSTPLLWTSVAWRF